MNNLNYSNSWLIADEPVDSMMLPPAGSMMGDKNPVHVANKNLTTNAHRESLHHPLGCSAIEQNRKRKKTGNSVFIC